MFARLAAQRARQLKHQHSTTVNFETHVLYLLPDGFADEARTSEILEATGIANNPTALRQLESLQVLVHDAFYQSACSLSSPAIQAKIATAQRGKHVSCALIYPPPPPREWMLTIEQLIPTAIRVIHRRWSCSAHS